MPPFKLQPAELDGLVAFIRAGFDVGGTAVKVGDAARGQALFDGKGACATCHRVNGDGPRVAPDLSDIGAVRTPARSSVRCSIRSTQMMPINRPVRIVTRDGRTIRGRRLNEDTYTVQLIDEQERLVSLDKADLRELELAKTSPMPPATRTLSTRRTAGSSSRICFRSRDSHDEHTCTPRSLPVSRAGRHRRARRLVSPARAAGHRPTASSAPRRSRRTG